MRELFLVASLLLGSLTVWTSAKVINYSHSPSVIIPGGVISPKHRSYTLSTVKPEPQNSVPIYEKNAFDELRGVPPKIKTGTGPTPPPPGSYTFEVRGIHILGEKKMALITAAPIRKTNRNSPKNSESKLVHEGDELAGYKVTKIEPGIVNLQDGKGNEFPVEFDLTSEASMKRAQTVQKKTPKKIPVNKK